MGGGADIDRITERLAGTTGATAKHREIADVIEQEEKLLPPITDKVPDLEDMLNRQLRIIETSQQRLERKALTGKNQLAEIQRLSSAAARVSAEMRQLRESKAHKAQELPDKGRRIEIAIAIFKDLRPEERAEVLAKLQAICNEAV